MTNSFKKAERFLTNPTIAITGPTGSGKTFSALLLATGIAKAMGQPFAVIDTENGSASLYSEYFDFDTMVITPPFTTEKYIQAINDAEKAGYCALIVDSITHAWAGEGGLLEQKAQLDARPNSNHWTNWNPIKAKDLKFRNAYLHSSIPFFIATMRSKMEYAQSENAGKKKVEKVGMAPVQSDGIEYEFSVVFDIAMNHEAEVSKDRTHLYDTTKIFQITEDTGKMLVQWRDSGKTRPPAPVQVPQPPPQQTRAPWTPEQHEVASMGPRQTAPSWPSENENFNQEPSTQVPNRPFYNQQQTNTSAPLPNYATSAKNSAPAPSTKQHGIYVIPSGKYKGQTFDQIPPNDMVSYISYLRSRGALSKQTQELVDAFNQYSGGNF